jgi:uncharacterized protein YukJ
MPLNDYGVLKGRVLKRKQTEKHYEILIGAYSRRLRASVNVKSEAFPAELLYYAIPDFDHPVLEDLVGFQVGFTPLKSSAINPSMDYIRDNMLDPGEMMKPMPARVPGPDNDLHEKLDSFIKPMIYTDEIDNTFNPVKPTIYVFGTEWKPRHNEEDTFFGFSPSHGVHNIHMNQGNSLQFKGDDGVWQDGALLLHYPEENRWSAVFLAFQTQGFHTDDKTGARLAPEPTPDHPETPATDKIPARTDIVPVRIAAALVNPIGDDLGKETVTFQNTTHKPINLTAWEIIDKEKRRQRLDGIEIPPNSETTIRLSGNSVVLANNGGTITLLNENGIKVDGVAYSRAQVRKEGIKLRFREAIEVREDW